MSPSPAKANRTIHLSFHPHGPDQQLQMNTRLHNLSPFCRNGLLCDMGWLLLEEFILDCGLVWILDASFLGWERVLVSCAFILTFISEGSKMSYMGDCISPECRPLRRRLCQSSKKGSNNERCLSLPGAYCRKDGKVLLQLCYSRPAEDRCCMQRPKSRDVQRVYTSLCSCVWVILRWSPGVSVKCVAEAK